MCCYWKRQAGAKASCDSSDCNGRGSGSGYRDLGCKCRCTGGSSGDRCEIDRPQSAQYELGPAYYAGCAWGHSPVTSGGVCKAALEYLNVPVVNVDETSTHVCYMDASGNGHNDGKNGAAAKYICKDDGLEDMGDDPMMSFDLLQSGRASVVIYGLSIIGLASILWKACQKKDATYGTINDAEI